jgi:hypothetical protein
MYHTGRTHPEKINKTGQNKIMNVDFRRSINKREKKNLKQ